MRRPVFDMLAHEEHTSLSVIEETSFERFPHGAIILGLLNIIFTERNQ